MLVLGISGSPRKNKNSEKILQKVLSPFTAQNIETRSIKLSEVDIKPCKHCDYCKTHDCCGTDEKANEINDIIKKANAIIVVSPVYFGGISGQLKCLFDKTLPLRRNGFLLKGKVGAAISVGGSRSGGQELTLQNIHAWMMVHGMITVGDNSHFGGTVHHPLEKDEFGQQTINGTIEAVSSLLKRLS